MSCFGCGQEGHRRSECPTNPSKMKCYNCQEYGHGSRKCPNNAVDGSEYVGLPGYKPSGAGVNDGYAYPAEIHYTYPAEKDYSYPAAGSNDNGGGWGASTEDSQW